MKGILARVVPEIARQRESLSVVCALVLTFSTLNAPFLAENSQEFRWAAPLLSVDFAAEDSKIKARSARHMRDCQRPDDHQGRPEQAGGELSRATKHQERGDGQGANDRIEARDYRGGYRSSGPSCAS